MVISEKQNIGFLDRNQTHDIVRELIAVAEVNSLGTMHMTANENVMSRTASKALQSSLSNRYHIGTKQDYDIQSIAQKGSLIFRGLPNVYKLEQMAHNALNKNLGGKASDTRLLSGMHAMISTISSLTNVGDTILSVTPKGGGHFATGNLIRQLGRQGIFVDYDPDTLMLSLSKLSKLKKKHDIKMVILDDSSPLFVMPFREIKDILGDDILIVYDASHTLGLIYGKAIDNPLDYGIDIIQSNTHKTFPGPQKGIIHYAKKEHFLKAQEVIGNSLVSSQHTHHSIALYVTILEMDLYAEQYAKAMIQNASVFAEEIAKTGLELLNNGNMYTQTNQVLIKVPKYMSNREAFEKILKSGISVNVKNVFNTDVIRIGVQELTRRGMGSNEMRFLAKVISNILLGISDPEAEKNEVADLNEQFDKVLFSFDTII